MKKAMLAMILLAGSALAGPRISLNLGFGVPVAPAPVVVAPAPVCPGPGYVWVAGYYGPTGIWVPGFWRAPVVAVAPRFVAPTPLHFAFDRARGFRR